MYGIVTLFPGAAPVAVGENATLIVQLSVGCSVFAEHRSCVIAKAPAGSVTVPITASASPLLATVIVCVGLVVPTAVSGNAIALDAGVMSITPCVPVPLSATVCGDPTAPVYGIVTLLPGAPPPAVGEKVTLIVQLSVGCSVFAEHRSCVIAKAPAGSATVPITALASPLLATVMVCAALVVPTGVSGNEIAFETGVMSITPWRPVPFTETVCGEPAAPV